jgi:hypothetical protein
MAFKPIFSFRPFSFRPLPSIPGPLTFSQAYRRDERVSPLGPLQDLPGIWTGTGFNVIWRPNHTKGHHRHFLELNLTSETLHFEEIRGHIPNRGLLQDDIYMYGLTYRQEVADLNNEAGLHLEPGIWATVPQTQNPSEPATVVRMASVPHGTTVLAQGEACRIPGGPAFPQVDIRPFKIGHPEDRQTFVEMDLSQPSAFRSPPHDIRGVTQWMVDNPNAVLFRDRTGVEVAETMVLHVASTAQVPEVGGGVANTAFLKGAKDGPNAEAVQVDATFWIETVLGHDGRPGFHQLQYTQIVLLNFAGLSWPHVTVATLRK